MSETATETQAHAERTPLVDLLGGSARVRIASVFATKPSRELSISEVSRLAGASRNTVYTHVDADDPETFDLVDLGVVERLETNGPGHRYRFDGDSMVAEKLRELSGAALRRRQELRDDVEAP
jgi:hypothetical protein